MLKIDDAIILNKYGQGIIDAEPLVSMFSSFELLKRKNYLKELIALIIQSRPREEDIESAILESKLKPTYTPCVLLRKGIANHHLQKITELPELELNKAFLLLLGLFKVSYQRRYLEEKNSPDKWWYWDLSDSEKVKMMQNKFYSNERN